VLALGSGKATILGGQIEMLAPTGRPLNAYEIFEGQRFGLSRQRHLVEKKGFAATANVLTHRAVFDRVGLFDAELTSSGDREWSERAVELGEVIGHCESAIVFHPRRSTFGHIYRKSRRIIGGRVILMRKKRSNIRFWWRFSRSLLQSSILNPQVHGYALQGPQIKGIFSRIHFFFLVELLSVLTTFERLRLVLGGKPYRG